MRRVRSSRVGFPGFVAAGLFALFLASCSDGGGPANLQSPTPTTGQATVTAQTTGDAVALYGEDIATIVGIATAIDMEAANTGMEFWFTGQVQATNESAQPSLIFLPYGLELTVDINAVSALALTLHAQKLSL